MSFFTNTWFLFLQLMRTTLRMPIWVVLAIFQPILWLVLFGQLFRVIAEIPGFENASYQQFLAPGIVVMSAVMSSSYSGLAVLQDIRQGVLDRHLATPVERSALMAARVLQSSVTVIGQAVVILAVAWLFGVRSPAGWAGIVAVLVTAALLAAATSSLSNALALLVRNEQTLIPVVNFIMLPALFTSSMMMSRELMPGWIRTVAVVNPLDWGVRAARTGFEAGSFGAVVPQVALLVAGTVVGWFLATKSFDRYRATL